MVYFILEEINYLVQVLLTVSLAIAMFSLLYGTIRNEDKEYERVKLSYSIFAAGGILALLAVVCLPFIHLVIHILSEIFGIHLVFGFFGYFDYFNPVVQFIIFLLLDIWIFGMVRHAVLRHKMLAQSSYLRAYAYSKVVIEGDSFDRYQMLFEASGLKEMPFLLINPIVEVPGVTFSTERKCYSILLPNKPWTVEGFDMAIMHEFCHVRRHDLEIRRLLLLLDEIFWFFGLQKKWKKELLELQEALCDQEAAKRLTNVSINHYYENVIDFCKAKVEDAETFFTPRELSLEGRMKRLIKDKLSKKHPASVSVPVSAVTFLVLLLFTCVSYLPWLSMSFGEKQIDLTYSELTFDSSSEMPQLSVGQRLLRIGEENDITLQPGEYVGTELFRGKPDRVCVYILYADKPGVSLAVIEDGIPAWTDISEREYNGAFKTRDADYEMVLRNDSDQMIEIVIHIKN